MVHVALMLAPARAGDMIFGRPLLERLLLVCARAGVTRFFIEVPEAERAEIRASLGSFRDDPSVDLVESLDQALAHVPADVLAVLLRGSLVLSAWQLRRADCQPRCVSREVVELESTDEARGGGVLVGPAWPPLDGDQAGAQIEPTRPVAVCAGSRPRGRAGGRAGAWRARCAARAPRRTRRWRDGSIGGCPGESAIGWRTPRSRPTR